MAACCSPIPCAVMPGPMPGMKGMGIKPAGGMGSGGMGRPPNIMCCIMPGGIMAQGGMKGMQPAGGPPIMPPIMQLPRGKLFGIMLFMFMPPAMGPKGASAPGWMSPAADTAGPPRPAAAGAAGCCC